jgi:hypothetical protein
MSILAYRTATETKSARTEQARADLILSVKELETYTLKPKKYTLFVKGSTFRVLNKDAWHYRITRLFTTCIARYTEVTQSVDAEKGLTELEGRICKWSNNQSAMNTLEDIRDILGAKRLISNASASAPASTSPSQSHSSSGAQAAASSASASPVPSPENPHVPRAFSANEETNLLFWEAKKKELEAKGWPWQAIKHIEKGILEPDLESKQIISWKPESFERILNSFIENVPAEIWNQGEPLFNVVEFIQTMSRAESESTHPFDPASYLIALCNALLEASVRLKASVLDVDNYTRLISQASDLPREERTKEQIDQLVLTFVQDSKRRAVPFPRLRGQQIPSAASAARPTPVRDLVPNRPRETPHSMSPIPAPVSHRRQEKRKRAASASEAGAAPAAAANPSPTAKARIPAEAAEAAPVIATPASRIPQRPLFGPNGTYNWDKNRQSLESVIENSSQDRESESHQLVAFQESIAATVTAPQNQVLPIVTQSSLTQ